MRPRQTMSCALLAFGILLLALTGCNPFAPSPIAATPTPPAEYVERANDRYRTGIEKQNRGDFRGSIQDLERFANRLLMTVHSRSG